MDSCENSSKMYSLQNESVIINDDGDISETKVRVMLLVSGIILIPMFCLLGSIGNILSLCVLFHKRMRNRINYVLAALCISDTLFLIHCLIYTGLNIYRKINPDEGETLRAHVYPIVGAYGSVVTARITSCLTLLLCAERFVAVYFPMRARGICNTRNTCMCVGFIYVITLVLFIPLSLKYEAKEINLNRTTNSFKTVMNTTDFFYNNVKFFAIYGTFLNVVFRFVPLVMILILNALMIRILHINWKKRRQMSEPDRLESVKLTGKEIERKRFSSNGQRRVTIMLLTVSFIFFLCILPGALNSIASNIWPEYSRLGAKRNLYTFISAITFLLETVNSSVNFIIYMALSRKFRLLYKEKFCCGHGQYLRQFSVSSIRERFRRSSHIKTSDKGRQSAFSPRKTHSDVGLCRKSSMAVKDSVYHGHHSDVCDMTLFRPNGRLSLKGPETRCVGDRVGAKKLFQYSTSEPSDVVCNSKYYIRVKDVPNTDSKTCNYL